MISSPGGRHGMKPALGAAMHAAIMVALPMAALLAAQGTATWQVRADDGKNWHNASLADFRQHLTNLGSLVEACRKQRTAQVCDRTQVGQDDRLEWTVGAAGESREIQYDWLRNLLERAGKKETAPTPASILPQVEVVKEKPATVDEMLAEAGERLKNEGQRAEALMNPTGAQAGSGYAGEHKLLAAILARRAYQGVSENSARERFFEWLDNLINDWLGRLAGLGGRARWLPHVLLGLLIVGVLIGLVWALIQIERRARIRLVPEMTGLAGSPSAREWQLWLKDAQEMAARGRWREAIHFLYWAAISRLESKRLWPADLARTPREYLLLLPAADPRRADLTTLTKSFERTWYGGREADSPEYEAARTLAAALGVE